MSHVLNRIAKMLIERPRPGCGKYAYRAGRIFISERPYCNSHSGVYTLAYLVCKNMDNKKKAALCAVLLSALGILISLSRIYLGVHYASDVLGGFFVGLASFGAVGMYFYPYKKEKEKWRAKMRAKEQAKIDALEDVEVEVVDREDMLEDLQAQYDEDKRS